jgi:glycerophosphoryl diester phosphodiesterase
MQVIAHRGLRNEKPENSLEAILAALQIPQIGGVEFDVELTADGKSVVLHQETLVPTADYRKVELASRNFSTRDWVIENDAAKLVAMDAGSWMNATFSNVRIPTLADVMSLPWGDAVAYVELKDATYWGERNALRPEMVVKAALPDLGSFRGNVNVISFNPNILTRVRAAIAGIPTTLALWTEWRGRVDTALIEAEMCGASTISLPDFIILEDPAWIRQSHERSLQVHAYPVSPARGEPEFLSWTAASQVEKWKRLEALGVDAILSDFARESLVLLHQKR